MRTSTASRCLLTLCALLAIGTPARANDFPTADRVNYVLECMRTYPGARFEMSSKCSCALDAIAKELPFDEYVELSTAAKAMSIGGERGSAIRDVPSLEPGIKRYRALVIKAETGCFLRSPAR
ncbi:hypothetical protein [Ideonella sp. A 288]|uniref:hypothetical protein n=1 Tax=Ideonella sp. A 288 TaxID=1962181 RepID=UPI0018FEF578|nr:hypothetical protein [Ideonella sp. A 288]